MSGAREGGLRGCLWFLSCWGCQKEKVQKSFLEPGSFQVPSLHSCPARWPLKGLEDSYRFRSPEGPAEGERETHPLSQGLQEPPGKAELSSKGGSLLHQAGNHASQALPLSFFHPLCYSLPYPSFPSFFSSLLFLLHLCPSLISLHTQFPLLAALVGSTNIDQLPSPELGLGKGIATQEPPCFLPLAASAHPAQLPAPQSPTSLLPLTPKPLGFQFGASAGEEEVR